jgi:hypothetical protein
VSRYCIIDTFPQFRSFWKAAQHKPMAAQIDTWASEYMSQWPELLEKQVDDYKSEEEDWRQIARDKVFPFLGQRLPAMETAHQNLLRFCAPLHDSAQRVLEFESDINFVIYVGIGCGAGWVTTFDNTPAILFGLENIAECGWIHPPELTGMLAHEIGHVAHFHWRETSSIPNGSGPWWQLYTEGFAQRCEHLILGEDTWHMRGKGRGDDWLDWCQDQKSWLADEFLQRVDAGESVRPFFGSWFEIRGRKQCGYFLGHELIRRLEIGLDLKEIALLDSSDARIRLELEKLADR